MNATYSGLSKAMEDFLVELKSRHEQQRVEEEEAAKIKKIREEQVCIIQVYSWQSNECGNVCLCECVPM